MPSELQEAFGEGLRAVRRSRGMTQAQFAEALGISRSYVDVVERGRRNLTMETATHLARRVGVDPVDLILVGRATRATPPALRAAATGEDPGPDLRKRPNRRS